MTIKIKGEPKTGIFDSEKKFNLAYEEVELILYPIAGTRSVTPVSLPLPRSDDGIE